MGEIKEYITYPDEKGSINISEEVISVIAANAALEVDGVASLSSMAKDIVVLLGKKNLSKGVKVTVDGENGIKADVYILTKLGVSVNKVGTDVQAAVASAIESTIGVAATEVNVHICGVELSK